ncbi:hypothetical protein [Peribacillus sp. TH14]|uniref:hypothetical protein n=1 Tax=Peribacillus sp. TH14 TaxID=2798481 RepID=UPI001911D696|nr:hypothetical protein [Peribacillus sp. TH14]MBK5500930.1 hypothetical protein [Peribacillus sp. TH14]
MTNLQAIKDKIEQAYDLKQASTGVYRRWQDEYRAEVSKISRNRNLTDSGKFKLKELLAERKTVELMKLSKSQQDEYRSLLIEAQKEARKVADSKPAAADKAVAERFDKSFGELKTAVMLATPEKAVKILNDFVEGTEEPALVDKIRAEFSSIIAPVVGQAKQEDKNKLIDLFEHTQRKAKGAEVMEAEQLMEQAEGMSGQKFFGLAVMERVIEVHAEAKKYLNDPDAFFEEYPGTERINTTMRTEEEVMLESASEIE